MSSAFKNFFITFIICLVVFGFVGFRFVYPVLSDALNVAGIINPQEQSDPSGENSDGSEPDTSSRETSESSRQDDSYDPNGEIFTAAILLCDDSGKPLAASLLDSNGRSKRFLLCSVPVTLKVFNEVGVSVPLADLVPVSNDSAVCSMFGALTGIKTDYCLRVDRESLKELVSQMPGMEVTLSENISFINPAYVGFVPEEGEEYPADYYINVTDADGRVNLNDKIGSSTKLEWLLEYNPNADGSPYNGIYITVAKAVYKQFFQSESELKSTSVLTKFLEKTRTNLTPDLLSENLDPIFSYDDYRVFELTYPGGWEKSVERLREADGRRE